MTKYRTWFTGTLETQTALHIGTGSTLSTVTNAPILRGADNTPVIPGSSLKGALRSSSERLLRALGKRACMVFGDSDIPDKTTECLTTDKQKRDLFSKLKKGEKPNGEAKAQLEKWALAGWGDNPWKDFGEREDRQLAILKKELCSACLTWGSPFMAGCVRVPDLRLSAQHALGHATEIRDGVGLDRDSGTAADSVKFDLEVLPAGAQFDFELVCEPEANLAVVCLAIGELRHGNVPLGGRTTRGLGHVTLDNFCIKQVDLSNPSELVGYLLNGKAKQYQGAEAAKKLEEILMRLMEEDHAA